MLLHGLVATALSRLDDEAGEVWSNTEIEDRALDGYNAFARRTGCIFDIVMIENLPPTGGFGSDLQRFLAESTPGHVIHDRRILFTQPGERDKIREPIEGLDLPINATVASQASGRMPGGKLPDSVVSVVRVAWDRATLEHEDPQSLRRRDAQFETRDGDPQAWLWAEDGLLSIRIWPAAQGDAVYDSLGSGPGTLRLGTRTQLLESVATSLPTPAHYWPMEETALPLVDVIAGGGFNFSQGVGTVSSVGGKNGTGIFVSTAPIATTNVTGVVFGNVPRTISIWYRPGTAVGSALNIWDNSAGDDTAIYFNSTTKVLELEVGSSTFGTTQLNPDVYNHVVYTHDGTGNHKVYLNGVLEITKVEPVGATSARFFLATAGGNAGDVDEMAYFTIELSAAQVTTLYNAGVGAFYVNGAWVGPPSAATAIVTTSITGDNSGGYGILRDLSDAFPSGGPHGTPTRIHPDVKNIKIEITRLGRDPATHDLEIPRVFHKYITFYAMSEALKREGPGQDLKLAKHYMDRFELGVARMQTRLKRVNKEKGGQIGGGTTETGILRISLPSWWGYARPVR